MKAITHHMTPLKQYLYIDCIEALPGEWSPFDNAKLTAEDCKPVCALTRYSWISFFLFELFTKEKQFRVNKVIDCSSELGLAGRDYEEIF